MPGPTWILLTDGVPALSAFSGTRGLGTPLCVDKLTGQAYFVTDNVVTALAGGSSGTAWGAITGTLSSQSDLQSALDGKQASGSYALSNHNHAGVYQPIDSDLTAIAALTTTTYGRALLALADAAALTALGNNFTSSLKGLVPLSGGGTTNFLRADGTWTTPSGGSDPWTTVKLALDYTNATTTFTNITDGTTVLTCTPPANTDWEMEARLLVWTTTIANLPRVGFLVASGATRGYGGVNMWQAGATAGASVHINGAWSDAAGITTAQFGAGGVLTASVPYLCEVIATGRSGASPTAISLQMAAETAVASVCYIKRGSFLKYRTF